MREKLSLLAKLLCAGSIVTLLGCGTDTSVQQKIENTPAEEHTGTADAQSENASHAEGMTGEARDETPVLADMSHYKTYDENTEYRFIDSSIDEFFELMEKKETFVTYIGYQDCNMCNQAMPILNEIAGNNDSYVYYINTNDENDFVSSRAEIAILKFGEYLDGYLEVDKEGYPELYVPFVIFAKDGKVVMAHDGVPTDGGFDGALNEEQANKLRSIYEEGFAKIAN